MSIIVVELCGSEFCTEEAALEVHWPGRSIKLCKPCTLRALRIADAMGLTVAVDRLPEQPAAVERPQ